MFQIGERVRCIAPFDDCDELVGKTGVVCYISSRPGVNQIGVEFDEEFSLGHDCRGNCRKGCGRFGNVRCVERLEDAVSELQLSFAALMGE